MTKLQCVQLRKTEILIEATPKFVEIWDENENHFTFQTFIDFE